MGFHSCRGNIVDVLTQVYPNGIGRALPIPKEAYRDDESLAAWPTPGVVSYLFKDAGARTEAAGDPAAVVAELDRAGIAIGQVGVQEDQAEALLDALEPWADRFVVSVRVNPHDGMRAVRRLESLARRYHRITSCSLSPHMYVPNVAPSSKEYYPIYAKCIELGLPVMINVGIPGPRVLSASQDPIHLDEVCWFFPELTVVMKHGGEPWVETCIKLMLKWPNLHFATSAFAPKYYAPEIIQYANTRGADRILYAGYYPILSFDDIVEQLGSLPLRDHVWPKFLFENARRVFRLDSLDRS